MTSHDNKLLNMETKLRKNLCNWKGQRVQP